MNQIIITKIHIHLHAKKRKASMLSKTRNLKPLQKNVILWIRICCRELWTLSAASAKIFAITRKDKWTKMSAFKNKSWNKRPTAIYSQNKIFSQLSNKKADDQIVRKLKRLLSSKEKTHYPGFTISDVCVCV